MRTTDYAHLNRFGRESIKEPNNMTHAFTQIFKNMETKMPGLKALNVTTVDGFSLFSHSQEGFDLEVDKLSAVTSSLTALSQAASKQVIGAQFESTCIETDQGLIFMVQTRYQEKDCILSLISGDNPNLGQIRYFVLRLAKYLITATLSADK